MKDFVSQAIVLGVVNYSEKGNIAKFFTREHGIVSCFMGKSTKKKYVLQPFSLLEIEYTSKKNTQLAQLKSSKNLAPYQTLYTDMHKTATLLFLSEIIQKTVKDEVAHPELFHFLRRELLFFDQLEQGCANFHLYFLSHLIEFLGFKPLHGSGRFFAVEEGEFVDFQPSKNHFSERQSKVFLKLLQSSGTNLHEFHLSKKEKHELLNGIVAYYRFHCTGFGELKSLQVLEEVYD